METEWMNETSAEAPSVPAPEKTEKKKFSLKGFGGKKKKRWLKILIILVVVIAIVAGCVSRLTKNVNTQLSSSYLVSTVTRRDQPVSIQLEPKAFQSFNDNTQTMEVRPGKYQILYGGSSDDKTLKKIDLVIE